MNAVKLIIYKDIEKLKNNNLSNLFTNLLYNLKITLEI